MPKLLRTIEKSTYSIYTEMWLLENGLKVDVSIEKNCDATIFSESGDVADQIYDRMVQNPRFNDIELIILGSYFIRIDKSLVHEFMVEIEKIDPLSLKEGKRY